jgi:hypothetical protein
MKKYMTPHTVNESLWNLTRVTSVLRETETSLLLILHGMSNFFYGLNTSLGKSLSSSIDVLRKWIQEITFTLPSGYSLMTADFHTSYYELISVTVYRTDKHNIVTQSANENHRNEVCVFIRWPLFHTEAIF